MFNFKKAGLLSAGLAMFNVSLLFAAAAPMAQAQNVDADVHKALDNKRFQGVQVTTHGPEVVLSGSVESYAAKEDADNRVHHVRGVKGVENEIQVSGPRVEDAELRSRLAKGLAYDRVGYGTTAFNAITLGVHDGVVTLGGTVYGPTDKDSAISLVANTPGVRDIVDNLEVAPLSPMDDQLRIRLANAIYGAPQLEKYAINPAKPIRITVVNGNVTLTGVVDNKMDHDVAGIKANTVPGVFKVVNDLQIAQPDTKN